MDLVRKTVYEKFCVLLKPEIEIITEKEKNAWLHFA
jgi:UDP-N-acetylenolpyruvoylglucosamine reductase